MRITRRTNQQHGFPFAPLAWLALLCLAWGCVTGPPSTVRIEPADTTPPGSVTSVTVATFNVWGLPSWVNRASSARYPKIARRLAQMGTDVVLLQEVWTRRSFEELSGLRHGPAREWWTASARHPGTFLGQNGLLTLSKYPIVGASVRHFSSASLPDSLMHKGALKVTVRLNSGERVNVWNVHLQDGGAGRVRARQVRELVDWVRKTDDGQIADIVSGDFTSTPESAEFRLLEAGIGPDVHQLAGNAPFPTWDGLKKAPEGGEALDHLFIRTRLPREEVQAVPWRIFAASRLKERLSDHLGLEATVRFGVGPGPGVPMLAQRRATPVLLETSALTDR